MVVVMQKTRQLIQLDLYNIQYTHTTQHTGQGGSHVEDKKTDTAGSIQHTVYTYNTPYRSQW